MVTPRRRPNGAATDVSPQSVGNHLRTPVTLIRPQRGRFGSVGRRRARVGRRVGRGCCSAGRAAFRWNTDASNRKLVLTAFPAGSGSPNRSIEREFLVDGLGPSPIRAALSTAQRFALRRAVSRRSGRAQPPNHGGSGLTGRFRSARLERIVGVSGRSATCPPGSARPVARRWGYPGSRPSSPVPALESGAACPR
jgi:hypothetical protein